MSPNVRLSRWTGVVARVAASAWFLGCGSPPESGGAGSGASGRSRATGDPAVSTPFATLADYFDAAEYARRRERLAGELDHGTILLFGAKDPMDAWDEHRFDPYFQVREFKQNEPVIYLTGVEEPGAVVTIGPGAAVATYLPGGGDTRDARRRLSDLGIEDVRPLSALAEDLGDRVASRQPIYMIRRERANGGIGFGTGESFSDLLPGLASGTMPEDMLVERVRARYPRADVRNLLPALERTWKAKSSDELALMRDVARISARGLIAGLRRIRAGVSDREVAGWIEGEMRREGAQRLAYAADVQSGPNLMGSFVTLFRDYDAHNRAMRDDDIVLVDHSAEFNYHVSDIARTVPVNGKFSPAYRRLYELYLEAYRAGLDALRPGASWVEVGNAAAAAVAARIDALDEEWLREAARTFVERYGGDRGGPGHFLGTSLSIHDDAISPLVPGQVMAYEMVLASPGRGLRVTIEDVVAVTADGYEILSAGLPVTVAEVEATVGADYRR